MTRATPPLVVAAGAPEVSSPAEEPKRNWRRPRWVVLLVVLLVLAGAGAVMWRVSSAGPAPLTRADVDGQITQRLEQAQREQRAAPSDAATAYQAILPSLVTITSERPGATTQTEVSLGAGVVVNADGAILTALHVVDGAQQVQVRFTDGSQSSAQVATRQQANDIAVLAVAQPPTVIVPAVLGGRASIGDAVFAVGHPLGLTQSLTAGVVSAVGRSVKVADNRTLDGLIQFDAAVNPGNSGGPLLNRDGQVVGIVTGLANPAQQAFFVGVGFAVPISTAGGAAGSPQQ
ncbi:MAG: S1C family serine protease [Dermatophilaceae bacterium]